MAEIEAWLNQYEATFHALSAFSTFAAVLVSLWLGVEALWAQAPRFRAWLTTNVVIDDANLPAGFRPEFVVVSITNKGTIPIRIPWSFFHWKPRFGRMTMLITALSFVENGREQYDHYAALLRTPVEVVPGQSQTIFLANLDQDERTLRQIVETSDTWLEYWNARLARPIVYAEDGTSCWVKISPEYRKRRRELLARAWADKKARRQPRN